MKPVRVLIADDHQLMRAGLRMLLAEMEPAGGTGVGVNVVAEASDGASALILCDRLLPDLVLMDIAMPVLNGLDALQQLRSRHPQIRVLMLSMLASEEHVIRALRLGAAGYLLKDSAPAELELAIAAVMRGETWLSSPISHQVVEGYLTRTSAGEKLSLLTPRQREVLRLLAEGKTAKEIAFTLTLSVKTIETHRTQIMERLDLHDLASLVRYAIKQGLIPLD
jgi:DNA-binding NarL/FixJ family response regulator